MSRPSLMSSISSVLALAPGWDSITDWVAGPHRWTAALFHHVATREDELTAGLGVTVTPAAFEAWLDHCERRFTFVSLDDLSTGAVLSTPKPPLLLTFDDAYASVVRLAAPTLAHRGIPSVFFVNGRLLDNAHLALDNLLAAVFNLKGSGPLDRLLPMPVTSVDEVLTQYVAEMSLGRRESFYADVEAASGIFAADLLEQFLPYLSGDELRRLPDMGMEIGNHTWSHVHTRALDSDGAVSEIEENQALLRLLTMQPIRAFAFPYGRRADATPAVLDALVTTGHEHVFLVEGRLNGDRLPGPSRRVSVHARSRHEAISELEVLPSLRTVRHRLGGARG